MEELSELMRRQAGMVARRQLLTYGVDADRVRNKVRSGRWVEVTPRVLSTTTGPPSWPQWLWLAVLHAGPRSLIGGLTAAGVHGLKGWSRPEVTVLVDDELAFEPVPGIDFFRSRRSFELLHDPGNALPVCRIEPAVLMYAAYDAPIRAAHGILAAAVQQRVTTASRLLHWVDLLRPLRRAPDFRVTLRDIDGGAHSGAELDVRRMCRRFGVPLPARQRPRTDRSGKRRWTDCEWDLPDGTTLVLEIDGGFHTEVRQWGEDLKRARRITTRRRIVVRCTAYELRHEPGEVATDLIALGVRARVPDDAA